MTEKSLFEDPRKAVQFSVGMASPLWPTFIAAAGAGMAFWAWAQWAKNSARHEFAGAPEIADASPIDPVAPLAAAPEPEPVPAPAPLKFKPPEEDKPPVMREIAPHTVIEAIAPAPSAPPKSSKKAKALASGAQPAAKPAPKLAKAKAKLPPTASPVKAKRAKAKR